MDLPNPSLNPPVLQPQNSIKRFSQHSRGHSRSPSHSPVRAYSPLNFDPLLRSLSPTATLHAFAPSHSHTYSQSSRSPSPRRRDLKASFSKVSDDQRQLGTRAAQACLDIRGWTRELQAWHWPGCLEEPEPERKKSRISVVSMRSLASTITSTTTDVEEEDGARPKKQFWGSLPAKTVTEYDTRCQDIATGLDEIDMDELKDYALQAYQHESLSIDGRLGSSPDGQAVPDRQELDDFTAIITATVLQTLPYLSELNRLLDTWMIRIAVLKQIPQFLAEMDRLKRDLAHGWAAIAVSLRKNGDFATLGAQNMQDMQNLIDARMTALGSTLDGFLDMLEGQEDTVPDMFLERFAELEERYAEWVVTAQHRVLGDELKAFEVDASSPITPTTAMTNGGDVIDRAKTPTLRDVERAKSPILLDNDGFRSSIFHEIERAKTPVIRDVDHARVSVFGSAADHAFATSFVTGSELHDNDNLEETQKSLVLPVPGEEEKGRLPADYEKLRLSSHTALPGIDSAGTPVFSEPRPVASRGSNQRNMSPARSSLHVPNVLPCEGNGSDHSESRRRSTAPGNRSSVETFDDAASDADPATTQDGPTPTSSRKGSVLSRLFRREKPSELKGDASDGSERSERSGRTNSSSFVRAARRSFSRKRSTKSEHAPYLGGRSLSPSKSRPQTSIAPVTHVQQFERPSLQIERASTMSTTERTTHDAATQHAGRPTITAVDGSTPHSETYGESGEAPRPLSGRKPSFPDNWPLDNAASKKTTELSPGALDNPSEDGARSSSAEDSAYHSDLRTTQLMAPINSDNFLDVFIGDFPAAPTGGVLHKRATQADLALASLQADREDKTESLVLGEERGGAESGEDISVRTSTPPVPGDELRVPVVTSSMLSSDGRQDNLSIARAISIDGLRQFAGFPAQYYSDKEVNTKYLFDTRDSSLPIPIMADGTDQFFDSPEHRGSHTQQGLQPESSTRESGGLTDSPATKGDVHFPDVAHEPLLKNGTAQARADSAVTPQELPAEEHERTDRKRSVDNTDDESGVDVRQLLLKRASTASIKTHAASELRSIDVPARKRESLKLVTTQIQPEVQPLPTDSAPGSHESSQSQVQRPGYSRTGSRSGAQSPTGSLDTPNFSRLRSSSADTNDHSAPLGIAIAKRRMRESSTLATISPSAEYVDSPSSPTTDVITKPSTKVVPADNFDRHVSEVLESLPAPIRFRNRAGDDISASPLPGSAKAAGPRALRPRNAMSSRASSAAGQAPLTLAPAEPSRRYATSDPEIKLYHLTQAGREEPIKLFVRLVGEGERVMVRVGGGWSDLADYLRQYAEHHASRTVSGSISGLELQTATNSPAGSRHPSGAVPPTAERRGRPTSRDGYQVRSPTQNVLSSPVSVVEGIIELPGSEVPQVQTPSDQPPSKLGRSASKEALSDQKARWVTRMLEKAKRETAPARRNKDSEAFGSMGKAGSTKRLIFRGPSTKAGTAKNEEKGGKLRK